MIRLLRSLLRDTDRPALLALQSALVLAAGVYLALRGYFAHDCTWPCERADWRRE